MDGEKLRKQRYKASPVSHDICSHPPHGAVLRDGSVPSTSRIFAAPPHLGSSEHESDKRKRTVVGAAERSGTFIGRRAMMIKQLHAPRFKQAIARVEGCGKRQAMPAIRPKSAKAERVT